MSKALALTLATVMMLCVLASPAQAAEPAGQASIFGTVLDSGSSPLANVTIAAQNTETGTFTYGITNASGVYELTVPVGTYNITAGLENYTSNTTYFAASVLGVSGPYNFTLTEQLGTVQGYVLSSDKSEPVFKVVVTIALDNDTYYTGTTNSSGFYTISGITPGDYSAFAEKRGYNTSTYLGSIRIERTSVLTINFTLDEQSAEISGTVTDKNDEPLSDVEVRLVPSEGGQSLFTTTDSNGKYSITGLSAGTYTVTFEKDGYVTATKNVEFGPYEKKGMDLTLSDTPVEVKEVLFGYDLAHSLMIIGFCAGMALVITGVVISFRSRNKPEMLAPIEKKEEKKED